MGMISEFHILSPLDYDNDNRFADNDRIIRFH